MSDDRPVTGGRRFLRLAGMTAAVAGSHAKSWIKSKFQSDEAAAAEQAELSARTGERIAKTLGELKGAVMKVGQMASIATDILPRELAEPLRALQKEAPPMSYEVIAEQIEAELGAPPERLFARFEREPFAAASIGQVHRAATDDGREVVVKVQYPGVDKAVDSDLGHLKLMLRAGGLVKVKKEDMDEVFTEVKARLHEELDYCNEADNVRLFRAYHDGDPSLVIPDVVGERSSQRVLTMTYEPGDGLDELDARGYSQALRDQLGAVIFRVFAAQLFDFHVMHADPNPGNLAFRRDGTLVLYDYGCVKRIPLEIIAAYRDTIKAGIAEDYQGVELGLRALGVRKPGGPPAPFDLYKRWRDVFIRPFLGDEPYDYAAADLHEAAMPLVPVTLKYLDSFKPPPELVFIDRAIVGHYGNLRKLRARGRYRDLLAPYLEE